MWRDIDDLRDKMSSRMIDDAFDALRSGVTIVPQHDRCLHCLRKIERGSGTSEYIELEAEPQIVVNGKVLSGTGKPPHMAFLHDRCADELEEENAP